jgi:hypothetical protein
MGGYGSGRQAEAYDGTVEESLSLDVNHFVREGIIRKECKTSGTISWPQFTGMTSSIGYEAYCDKDSGNICLSYTLRHLVLGDKDFKYYVDLVTTEPNFGGVRWWFICPNQDCEKMVAKLYLPPAAHYFLCRTCQNLTYSSCRESHKWDSLDQQIAAETGIAPRMVKRIYKILLSSA